MIFRVLLGIGFFAFSLHAYGLKDTTCRRFWSGGDPERIWEFIYAKQGIDSDVVQATLFLHELTIQPATRHWYGPLPRPHLIAGWIVEALATLQNNKAISLGYQNYLRRFAPELALDGIENSTPHIERTVAAFYKHGPSIPFWADIELDSHFLNTFKTKGRSFYYLLRSRYPKSTEAVDTLLRTGTIELPASYVAADGESKEEAQQIHLLANLSHIGLNLELSQKERTIKGKYVGWQPNVDLYFHPSIYGSIERYTVTVLRETSLHDEECKSRFNFYMSSIYSIPKWGSHEHERLRAKCLQTMEFDAREALQIKF